MAAVVSIFLLSATTLQAQMEIKLGHVTNAVVGRLVQVPITMVNPYPGYELGGFDLLLKHPSALSLQGVAMGELLTSCRWEYFSQRIEHEGSLRIMAVADVANGATHPSCYANTSGEIVRINYMVLIGQSSPGDFLPLKWWWYGCSDNSFSDRYGFELLISDRVYDFNGSTYQDITGNQAFPTMRGAPDSCGNGGALRVVDYYNGGVSLAYVDTIPPVAVCPGNIQQNNDSGQCGAVVTWEASVTDNNPGAIVWCNPTSGSFFPVGASNVQCIAVDTAGNTDTCTFQITIRDAEYPDFPAQESLTVNNAPGECGAIVTYQPSSSDNCPGLTMQCHPPSGTYFQVGSRQVLAIAIDASWNYRGRYFTVTVRDSERPVVTCPGDMTVPTDSGQCGTTVTFTCTATDNCSGVNVVATPPSGSWFSVGSTLVTVIATDPSANADTGTFTVTVIDDQPPDISCPDNITVSSDSGYYGAFVDFDLSAYDNCRVASIGSDPEPETLFPIGITPVQIVAVDATGLADTCLFTVTVVLDDPDSDGLASWDDNCQFVYNPDQADADNDSIGDACDKCTDTDGDEFGNPGYPANLCNQDNCPSVYNPGQADADNDGVGDVCDECTDTDGDGFGNPGFAANTCPPDNCPLVYNPNQADGDVDGVGDACDECTDTDGDSFGNPGFAANTCATDNCPSVSNPDQTDTDNDGIGDACDECTDMDGDGFGNPGFAANICATDNCPAKSNPDQADTDADGLGDACCCIGPSVGNLDGSSDDLVTLGDLTVMIDILFITVRPAPCQAVANVDLSADGLVTMGDLTVMIDNLFISLTPLPACP
jgi:hypothetical protein